MQSLSYVFMVIALASRATAWMFDEKDGNGADEHPEGLTREQVDARMVKLFNIIDENKDGEVTSTELEKFNSRNLQRVQNMQLEQEMQMMDKNKDGFVDFEEISISFPPEAGTPEDFMEGLQRRFNVADKDGNGKLNKTEVYILLNPAHDESMLDLEVKDIMLTHDKNGDGLISIEEYLSSKPEEEQDDEFLEAEFKPFDLNNDGLLSILEIIAAFKEEARDTLETNLEDVIAIIGEGPIDFATWNKHALELSTSSITDHGELLRHPEDYDIDLAADTRERKGQDTAGYSNTEL
ncbi:EFh_CREC superfamily protein [Babesia bovis T2Bo]|uniref:Membrane-associated calcum-binding protein, putative n=1 Tax=Babesia bovis TaxID=5865 RepID=A7AP29_BABBO|nr:EFh_CREC superfamily protein [Babesia bovis T2Bo]EDO08313.1 EFh_CREC superfamily protein [Babesia bovis T2Bo]|eukprot:XP_001611881.1 membrane-associated calcum-binding protein [Babesia bovis T2Bo]